MGGKKTISTSETRVEALQLQSSAYGVTIGLLYGVNRIPGNMIWYGGFLATPHVESQSSGKGGGVKTENTTFTYSASVMLGLCEGVVTAIPRIWRGKQLYADGASTALAQLGLSLATGTLGQSTWPYLTTSFAPQAIGYSGLAHIYAQDYSLGNSAQVENHSFEVVGQQAYSISGLIPDADPAAITADALTHVRYGSGFPAGQLQVAAWSTYCRAANILLSPALTEQMQAGEFLDRMCRLTNTGPVWTATGLKMVPYGDTALAANGSVYTPDLTPVYDLTDDDFVPASAGADPIKVTRKSPSDAHNHIRVEFRNRANLYNIELAEAKDSANIDAYGLRSAPILQAHWIADVAIARQVAQTLLQRALYIRNTYAFQLPWTRALLEPMNLVTLTDSALNFSQLPVRVLEIDEDADGYLDVLAEDFPLGIAHAAQYPSQAGAGFQHDYNAAPGNVLPPYFFEAPIERTTTGLEVYAAVRGTGPDWGGCRVWTSLDGVTYKDSGVQYGGARYGTLTGPIASGNLPVVINGGQLLSGSATDSLNLATLCYIGGANPEYLAHAGAALTGALAYTLSGLTRSAFATSGDAHLMGDAFVRVDDALAKSGPLDLALIGQTIHFKFTSINVYGRNEEALENVADYTYLVTGAMVKLPPPDVSALFINGSVLSWPAVAAVDLAGYHIRYVPGTQVNWAAGQPLHQGLVTDSPYVLAAPLPGLNTFMVVAADALGNESAVVASVASTGALQLAGNTLESWPQAPLFEGAIVGGTVVAGELLADTSGSLFWGADSSLFWGDGTGLFWNPVSYGEMTYSFSVGVSSAGALVMDAIIDGAVVTVEMRRSSGGLFWGDGTGLFWGTGAGLFWPPNPNEWEPWPGQLNVQAGEFFEFRVTTAAGSVQGRIALLTPYLDVPTVEDYVDDAAVSSAGTRLTLGQTFRAITNIQLTVQQDGGTGVTTRLADKLATGPLVQVLDVTGTAVAGTVDARVKGY